MFRYTFILLACVIMTGCAKSNSSVKNKSSNVPESAKFDPPVSILENGESSHITVQHVLIGFHGSVQGKTITRSQAAAEKLANEVLQKAKSGEDFDALVKEYTDDAPPGIYRMANFGAASFMRARDPEDRVYPREGMVPAFGNVGFPLNVGEIGMSKYGETSPFGWHIVKRLK